ncbi:flavodoxin/nitric oxide synthase [Geobacter metallireducens RCH3]|uniref:Flavodoxin, putative n=1 Tax=Geobacter metallireducens (strain ATCC 53774 / DSM 7210 / GS-15) TaxID=269799 RepID=Q39WM8_GEOMG|nr:flavodoxin domain-containing protein [Geobacter metallireducens]ABB31346.1 flavodoxin, putative [Geobacter metallireducens GS-15]EHP85672.1 flavodoxin/nitric oxide synthase [Geobacter metallireducens RCH3]
MKKVLVTYYSRSGNTEKMARMIADGLATKDVAVDLRKVEEVELDTLPSYDGFIVGSPNYFGTMAWPVKKFVDESVKYFKKLDGKAAAAFTSEGMIGGGGDTVVLDILKAFLIHGCVVQGLTSAGHYGPVAVGAPDGRIADEVGVLVDKFAALVKRI